MKIDNNLIVQLVSIITLVVSIIGMLSKKKSSVLIWFTISNITVLFTYLLLGRFLGSLLVLGAALRTTVYYFYSRKEKKVPLALLVVFEIYFIVLSIILWQDIMDLFLLINLCLVSFTTWQDNMKILRLGYVVSSLLVITYSAGVGAYLNILTESLFLLANCFSLYKYHFKKQKTIQ